MAPRSKPRASKKKVASRSAAEMVLREEILGRVFDYLEVDEITSSAATCKQFDAALPRVTHLFTRDENFQRASGLVVRQRLLNVKHVEFDVSDSDLGSSFTNAVYLGKQLVSLKLSIYRSPYLEGDDEDNLANAANVAAFDRELFGFARTLKRGCLPNLDHVTISFGKYGNMYAEHPNHAGLDAVYNALPARAAVAAVISDTGNVDLLRRILDDNDLDINAVDSLGHTPLSLWCWNKRPPFSDDASIFAELVSRGADLNQLLRGFSPCGMAAASGFRTETKLRLLLEAGASLTVGAPPLPILCKEHATCNLGSLGDSADMEDAFTLLLEHGCDITGRYACKTAMQYLAGYVEEVLEEPSGGSYYKSRMPPLQRMMITLGRLTQARLDSACAEIDSLKKAPKRAAAGEPKTATRAKKKSRK